jgi:outer membrane protein
MQTRTVVTTLAALLACGASLSRAADADDPLDNQVRAGLYYVHFFTNAEDISGPFVPSGVNLRLKAVETLYLAYVRRLTPDLSLELAAGWPPLTKTVGEGPATLGSVPYNGQVISTARWFAPSLLLDYSFFDESSLLRPYVGLGINYTHFYSRQSTAAGNAATGGPTSISLPDSVGPAGTVGIAYHPFERWSFYASYSASMVNSRLTADTAGIIRTSYIHFWPAALVVSAGYSF